MTFVCTIVDKRLINLVKFEFYQILTEKGECLGFLNI
jgi:hypothetical protein